jgi:hypothetical protein
MLDVGGTGARAAEQQRVHRHLAGAESAARARRVRLHPLRAAVRRLLLDELRHYRVSGRYPRNHCFRTHAAPEFVDAHGTRCAVAHLMEVSGQAELVQHIAKTRNNARIRELARFAELRAWLAAAGLSLEEAARIQPEYCYETQANVCFCNQHMSDGVALGTVTALEEALIRVRVDRVEGALPGVQVGNEYAIEASGSVGEQVFFGSSDGSLLRRAHSLAIDEETVRCTLNSSTWRRPVSVNTALDALLAEKGACVELLATDDSAWNRSQCDQGLGGEDGGCALERTAADTGGAVELSSAALLVALVLYRRGRR